MSRPTGQPANAFSVPSSAQLGSDDVVEINVVQATSAIVQSWIATSASRPDENEVTSMIKAVRTALSETPPGKTR